MDNKRARNILKSPNQSSLQRFLFFVPPSAPVYYSVKSSIYLHKRETLSLSVNPIFLKFPFLACFLDIKNGPSKNLGATTSLKKSEKDAFYL